MVLFHGARSLLNARVPQVAQGLRTINGALRYALLGELGKGGDGRVYPLGADRAVKMYKRPGETQEGEILTACPSPFFVEVFAYDENHLVMERLGKPIGHWRAGIRRMSSPSALLTFLEGVGPELQRYGINHRDINPGNILFDPRNDRYKLTDFYAARRFAPPQDHADGPSRYSCNDALAIETLIDEAHTKLARARLKNRRVDPVRSGPVV